MGAGGLGGAARSPVGGGGGGCWGRGGQQRGKEGDARHTALSPSGTVYEVFLGTLFSGFFLRMLPRSPWLLRGSFSSDAEDSSITSIAQLKISR